MKKQHVDTVGYYNQEAEGYNDTYYYPNSPDTIRLKIILRRFKELGCKTVVDAGCGSGYPMLKLLKQGFDARGFDFSPGMVTVSKNSLKKAGYPEEYACFGDIEKEVPFPKMKFDGMMMHGPLMHVDDPKKALENAYKMLNSGGTILCEARNELMAAFSMNEYSEVFYKRLIDYDSLPPLVKKEVDTFYTSRLTGHNYSFPSTASFQTRFFNPLTIHELFEECGFTVVKLHFAHYHALPPMFIERFPEVFKERSLRLEGTDDWRGYLLASTYLVEARK